MEKRLKKVSKQEAASLKLLEKQEAELVKAVEENDRLVETVLTKETPAEVKIRAEIDKLTGKLRQINCDLEKVRILTNKVRHLLFFWFSQVKAKREEDVRPLRLRGMEMTDKLDMVRYQLASTRTMRERSMSTSSLDTRDKTKLDLSMTIKGSTPGLEKEDPPPYNFS